MLGGLVPPTLTRTDTPGIPAHLGTTDVDILLVTHLTAEHDLGRIEMALETMQFTPQTDGWRWSGRIEDRIVKIEFLCDLDNQPAEAIVSPVGCSRLRAVNLRGTGYVERDHHEYILHVPEGNLRVQIAGLAGYLLSKSVAVRTRGADKDYYDLAYVLLHNDAGGPTEAANIVKASPLADALPGMELHLPGDTRTISQRPRTWRASLRPRSTKGHPRGRRATPRRRRRRSNQRVPRHPRPIALPTRDLGGGLMIAAMHGWPTRFT